MYLVPVTSGLFLHTAHQMSMAQRVVFNIHSESSPKRQIFYSSKLKEFADDNFRFYENGRQFFKPLENNEEKGEITRYEQILLFPECFQKICTAAT